MAVLVADYSALLMAFSIRLDLCRYIVNQEERKRTRLEAIKDHRAQVLRLRSIDRKYYIGR